MSIVDRQSNPVPADALTGLETINASGPARPDGQPTADLKKSFGLVAELAAIALNAPRAAVMIAGEHPFPGIRGDLRLTDQQRPIEQLLCAAVFGSGEKLIVDGARPDNRASTGSQAGSASVTAWAGCPVHNAEGLVAGVLWVADQVPRAWSAGDIAILEALAELASGEVALRAAVARSAVRAALAQTLQESLLPPRLPSIPGLQVAARHAAGGTETDVLGDFYDVFPSVRGNWGLVVGDVCGKGVPAAKSTALARYTLRAGAHRRARPSLILAGLNQALLDWLTEDPRFLTAIYATVRPTRAGASVQISSAGHPLALIRRADGRVQEFGRPGTLLGLLPDPELHDSQRLLRAGDSLIMFSDGVTEARARGNRELYGEERLGRLIAGLGDVTAAQLAEAIQRAALAFSGGQLSDDTVALVLQVPRP
jgi:phosphoserine phosphatase RsbU/P